MPEEGTTDQAWREGIHMGCRQETWRGVMNIHRVGQMGVGIWGMIFPQRGQPRRRYRSKESFHSVAEQTRQRKQEVIFKTNKLEIVRIDQVHYSFNRNAWSTHQVPDPAAGEAEESKVGTVSILMDVRALRRHSAQN